MKNISIAKLTALLLVLIMLFTTMPLTTFAFTPSQMKTTDNLSLRTAPSTSASRITVIPAGTVVSASAQDGAWYKVTYNGNTGWSHGDYLAVVTQNAVAPAPTAATSANEVMVTTTSLSMRTGPGTSYSRILVIPSGASVTVSATSGVWKKVTYNSRTGWSHSAYLKTASQPAPAPAPALAPAPVPAPVATTSVTLQTTTDLSLRTGPSTAYTRLLVMPGGAQVSATETSGEWKKVNYKGTVGWAHGAYLKTVPTQVVASSAETTPPPAPSSTTTSGYAIAYADANQGQKEIFAQTNLYRAGVGKSKLSYSAGLSAVAQSWAKKMAANNNIAHSPTGDVFGNWQATGENVALFYESVGGAKLVEAWKNSAGHKFNLDYAYTHIGVGYYIDGNGYTWAVQIFAKYSYGIGSDVAPWIH